VQDSNTLVATLSSKKAAHRPISDNTTAEYLTVMHRLIKMIREFDKEEMQLFPLLLCLPFPSFCLLLYLICQSTLFLFIRSSSLHEAVHLNPARGLGSAVSSHSGIRGEAYAAETITTV